MVRYYAEKSFREVNTSKSVVYFGVPVNITLRGNISPKYSAKLFLEQLSMSGGSVESADAIDYTEKVKDMFSDYDIRRGRQDITGDEFYTSKVPMGVASGAITPQIDENGVTLFNGDGSITIAEVLNGLGIALLGDSSTKDAKKSIDNICYESDYFNIGYNLLCSRYSSVFFNLYERGELLRPITRMELAYLIVACSGVYPSIHENHIMGVSFDWVHPESNLSDYADINDYNVSLVTYSDRPSSNIKDYLFGRSMTELVADIKTGLTAVPLPMIMSMVELGKDKLFFYEDSKLLPLRNVTRGELCFLLVNLMTGGSKSE